MKKELPIRFLAACAFALAVPLAQAAPAPAVDFKTANDAFLKAGRNNKVAIGEVSNAFARVLSSTNLTADARLQSLIEFGRFHGRRRLFEPSLACFETAFAIAKADPRLRVKALDEKGRALSRQNFEGGFATYYHEELDRAHDTFLRIVALPFATGEEKVTAMKNAATALLDAAQEVDPAAEALFVKATELPGLSETDRIRAKVNLADYYVRSLQGEKARPVLEPLLPLRGDKKLDGNVRRSITRTYVEMVFKTEGFDKALDLITKGELKDSYHPQAVARFCLQHGRPDKELAFMRLATPGPGGNKNERAYFMLSRRWNCEANAGLSNFRDYFETAVIPFLKERPDQWNRALQGLNGDTFRRHCQFKKAPLFVDWFFGIQDQAPVEARLTPEELFPTVLAAYDVERTGFYARKIVETNDPKTRHYGRAGLALAVLEGKDSEKAVPKVFDWLKRNPPKDEKARGAAVLDAARMAMGFRHEQSARALFDAYGKLIVRNDPAELGCPFVKDAPQNVAQIVASDFYKKGKKDKLDRKFGEHLQFLLDTDSAVTGRKVVEGEKDAAFPEIFAFCDDRGVKILIDAPASKEELKKFRQGFSGTASYEAYFAAGFDAPYDFLLLNPGSYYGDSGFNTQYDNSTGYRNLSPKKENLEVSYLIDEDSVTTMIAISWAPYFSKLPENGTVWYFEPIIWMRGGLSWGGSESVHHRSSFGRLVFEGLTPENRTAIKRGLVSKAVDLYRRSKHARNNGQIEIWKDPELGDQAFYAACVKPLCDRLDPYEKLVKAEMTDEEVEKVFDNAAETWFNINYVVAKLRRDYLDAKRVRGE